MAFGDIIRSSTGERRTITVVDGPGIHWLSCGALYFERNGRRSYRIRVKL